MAKIISASIDLTKIEKSKIIEHKNGAKYFNIDITINDEKDQYGQDVSIATSQTKQARDAKEKKTYLGNGKTVWDSNATKAPETETNTASSSSNSDDLPF